MVGVADIADETEVVESGDVKLRCAASAVVVVVVFMTFLLQVGPSKSPIDGLLLLVAGLFVVVAIVEDVDVIDDVVGPATILFVFVTTAFGGPATLTAAAANTDVEDVEELPAAVDAVEGVVVAAAAVATAAVPTADAATVVILCESSLCHLALLCRAAFICVHNSFLQDFDLKIKDYLVYNQLENSNYSTHLLIDCNQSLN